MPGLQRAATMGVNLLEREVMGDDVRSVPDSALSSRRCFSISKWTHCGYEGCKLQRIEMTQNRGGMKHLSKVCSLRLQTKHRLCLLNYILIISYLLNYVMQYCSNTGVM